VNGRPGNTYLRIGIASALMLACVFVVGQSLRVANEPASLPLTGAGETPSIPSETGVFRLARQALDYRDTPGTPATGRSLQTFYERRAYPGAPPIIPHALADPTSYGGATCLACHADGGWVPKFNAYAPVTPHADLLNCVQCHVPAPAAGTFRGSTFQSARPPAIRQAWLPGSPPPIPHLLQMRDNCLACHGGPAAVREVRTTHPERVNCRQCHVEGAVLSSPFDRGGVK
jgi:cytochrome c-type protein NapB